MDGRAHSAAVAIGAAQTLEGARRRVVQLEPVERLARVSTNPMRQTMESPRPKHTSRQTIRHGSANQPVDRGAIDDDVPSVDGNIHRHVDVATRRLLATDQLDAVTFPAALTHPANESRLISFDDRIGAPKQPAA